MLLIILKFFLSVYELHTYNTVNRQFKSRTYMKKKLANSHKKCSKFSLLKTIKSLSSLTLPLRDSHYQIIFSHFSYVKLIINST